MFTNNNICLLQIKININDNIELLNIILKMNINNNILIYTI